MDCELCGKSVFELYLISVEGAKLQVCVSCSKSGTVLGKVRARPEKKQTIIKQEGPEIHIVDDFAQLVMNGRQKLELDQKKFAHRVNESVSVVKKIEAGKMIPSEKTAKKIEKLLHIKLYHQIRPQSYEKPKEKARKLTLEDVVKIKKKE